MDPSDLVLLIPLPVLLVFSALFSGAETALFGMTYNERLALRRESPAVERIVGRLLAEPRPLLITLLVGNMTVNVMYFVLASVALLRADNPAVGAALNIALVLLIVLVGEVLAKMLAATRRLALCRVVVRPIALFSRVLRPLVRGLDGVVIGPLARLVAPGRPGTPIGVDELNALIELGARRGDIDPHEEEQLAGIVSLGTVRIRHIMTPRVEMQWLRTSDGPGAVREAVQRTRQTKIPVLEAGSGDRVAGMLDARPYLAADAAGRRPALRRFLEPARFVPVSATLDRLLEHFRRTGSHVALCVDERGEIVGRVEIEQVAEELVGVLTGPGGADEHAGAVRLVGLGEWSVPGRLSVRDWSEMFDLPPDPRVATVAGLVMAALGRIPEAGDRVLVGHGAARLALEVESMNGRVVDRVRVALAERPEDGSSPGPAGAEGAP